MPSHRLEGMHARGSVRCSMTRWQASMAVASAAVSVSAPSPVATHLIARTIAAAYLGVA